MLGVLEFQTIMSLVSAAGLAIVHALGSVEASVLEALGNLSNVREQPVELTPDKKLLTLFFSENFTESHFGLIGNSTGSTYLINCTTPSQKIGLSAVCI